MSEEPPNVELNTIFDPETCVKKGLCPVTLLRKQTNDPFESHSLYYELHGTGPEKIIFIMGLNSTSFSWESQVEHFARTGQHSVLVFDNRGVGNSDTPRGPYSTSGMAHDIIALLDYIGWTARRDLHVVGASLGGMIALELASSHRMSERIASLSLAVTTAGGWPWSNLPPWKGFSTLARLLLIKDLKEKVAHSIDMLFPQHWLEQVDGSDPNKRTNREVQFEIYFRRASNVRIQRPMGALSQMCAGLTHHVSPARLRTISKSIPKILIFTGDEDHLVSPRNSAYLALHMPEAEYIVWEGTGHAVTMQRVNDFNELVERIVDEGRQKVLREGHD